MPLCDSEFRTMTVNGDRHIYYCYGERGHADRHWNELDGNRLTWGVGTRRVEPPTLFDDAAEFNADDSPTGRITNDR